MSEFQNTNYLIFLGEITIINADDLEDVISFPDTPQKPKESPNEGISTQILPLSRLSLSSSASNSSPPNTTSNESSKNLTTIEQTPTGRPVAEVQPFNSDDQNDQSGMTVTARVKTSPVRDKLDKIRRSLTEPLIQYFHDLQSSTDSDEPEILNTPKSIGK